MFNFLNSIFDKFLLFKQSKENSPNVKAKNALTQNFQNNGNVNSAGRDLIIINRPQQKYGSWEQYDAAKKIKNSIRGYFYNTGAKTGLRSPNNKNLKENEISLILGNYKDALRRDFEANISKLNDEDQIPLQNIVNKLLPIGAGKFRPLRPLPKSPSRPEESHLQPLTDSVREPLDSYGSC